MSIQQNFPATRPSLNLNFARSQKLDPRITFTRTSSATRVNSDGLIEVIPANSPRFDFDPISGESLGLLVEESRTNLLLRSEEFDNASWAKARCSISVNTIAAPDGNVTADTLIEDESNNTHRLLAGAATVTANSVVTFSVYFKAKERSQINLYVDETTGAGGAFFSAYYSSSGVTGSTSGGGASYTSGSVQELGNGWYRASIIGTLAGGYTLYRCSVFPSVNGSISYQGDGTSGVYIWGAQLETGSFPTSYIPTTTSTATRTADNANIIGSNVESWYRQDEGTFISDSRILQSGVKTQGVWSIGDGTNQISLRSPQVTGDRFRGNIGNIFTVAPGTGDTLLNTFKAAISYTSTVGRLQVGTASNEVTPSQLPINPNTFGIGNLGGGSTPLNGIIRQIIYYPTALPPNQLITLTK